MENKEKNKKKNKEEIPFIERLETTLLNLNSGEIIVLRGVKTREDLNAIRSLLQSISLTLHKYNPPVIILKEDQSIETLDSQQMQKLGWRRTNPKAGEIPPPTPP